LAHQAVSDCDTAVPRDAAELIIHIFQLSEEGPVAESVGGGGGSGGGAGGGDGGGDEEVTTCSQWVLPAEELDGLWENLVYDHTIKTCVAELAPFLLSACLGVRVRGCLAGGNYILLIALLMCTLALRRRCCCSCCSCRRRCC
jgi:hypothetical protein